MTVPDLDRLLQFADPVLCLSAFAAVCVGRELKKYGYLAALLLSRTLFALAEFVLVEHWPWVSSNSRVAYKYFFYVHWSGFAINSILMLVVICSMYRLAMAPLKGLNTLGMLVFKWVAGISLLVAFGSAFAPHTNAYKYLVAFVSEMQRTQSILILCLLLFVTFAIRPMGLSYRSRIFGVSLGLGVMATTDMIQSAWISGVSNMFGVFSIVHSAAICVTLLTWSVYFVVPEPKRRLITLPTTSPFLRWNQISEVLGDSPGHVAIGGLPPDMLAPAEIEVMRRASVKMKSNWTALNQNTDAA